MSNTSIYKHQLKNIPSFNTKIHKVIDKNADKYIERAKLLQFENNYVFINNTIDDIITGKNNSYKLNEKLFQDIKNIHYYELKCLLSQGVEKSIEFMLKNAEIHNVALALTSNLKNNNFFKKITTNSIKEIVHNPYDFSTIISDSVIDYIDSNKNIQKELIEYITDYGSELSKACDNSYSNNEIHGFSTKTMSHSMKKEIFSLVSGGKFIPMENALAKTIFELTIKNVKNNILNNNPQELDSDLDGYFEEISLDDSNENQQNKSNKLFDNLFEEVTLLTLDLDDTVTAIGEYLSINSDN